MLKQGEVWKINHFRKGELMVRLLHDVDETFEPPTRKASDYSSSDAEWVNVELLEGRPQYVANETRIGLSLPKPSVGDCMAVRLSLIEWLERCPLLEQAG